MRYLEIRHGDRLFQSKAVYDFIFPGILAISTCILCYVLGIGFDIFSNEEFIKKITDLLTLMIVFYLAALAAVATFDRKGIDDPLRGGDAKLRLLDHTQNKIVVKILSYRQFISYLFGFLSFSSLCIYTFIIMMTMIWPEIKKSICNFPHIVFLTHHIFEPTISLLLAFGLWQLLITSMLGIYFLTERIQSLNDPHN
jgi:hypothetical protein